MHLLPHDQLYARFTDRARMVMKFAVHDAQRFNHEHFCTGHILLGLMRAGGIGTHVLQDFGLELRKLRIELERFDLPASLDTAPVQQMAMTPRAEKVLADFVWTEVRRQGHSYVGTEHLLLALTHDAESTAGLLLCRLGVSLESVRTEVDSLLGHGT